VGTRTIWSAPQGSIWAFSTQSDLASPANGLARAAISRDVIPGHETIHNPTFLNDGYYGNGSSWIGTGADSWIKIDLGQTVPVGNVRFGRDRIGHFDDRDPGRFQIFLATSDDVYANGNDQNDSQEYRSVFDSETVGFSGQISGSQTLLATLPATDARYVTIQFGADGAAIDEVEVMPAAEGSVATSVEAPPEADACATAPCGEFMVCTHLPGALTTAAGRSCACSTGYSGDGAGGFAPAAPLSWKMASDSRSSSTTTAMRSIASVWADMTGSRVNTSTYSWDRLGGESAVVSKLRSGQVDAAFLSTAGLTQLGGDRTQYSRNGPQPRRAAGAADQAGAPHWKVSFRSGALSCWPGPSWRPCTSFPAVPARPWRACNRPNWARRGPMGGKSSWSVGD
jgi:hypothetical protein